MTQTGLGEAKGQRAGVGGASGDAAGGRRDAGWGAGIPQRLGWGHSLRKRERACCQKGKSRGQKDTEEPGGRAGRAQGRSEPGPGVRAGGPEEKLLRRGVSGQRVGRGRALRTQ